MVAGINRLFIDWYSFPRPVVAAVNGHAVAGGVILALCADRRIGADDATYGLTELRVGVPYPAAAIACVRAELTPADARRLVLEARAHRCRGRASPRPGRRAAARRTRCSTARARSRAGLAELPTRAYETVKEQLRGPAIEAMRAGAADDPMTSGWIET